MRGVLCLLAVILTTAHAQLNDQPRSWLQLEGQFLRDVPPDDINLINLVLRETILQAQRDKTISPELLPLMGAVQQASARRDRNATWRYGTRFLAALQGTPMAEFTDIMAALEFRLDRRIVAPGDFLHARLDPLFSFGRPLTAKLTAQVRLLTIAGELRQTSKLWPVESLELHEFTLPTAGMPPGSYQAVYELKTEKGQALLSQSRPFHIHPDCRPRLKQLQARLDEAVRVPAATANPQRTAATNTAAYLLARLDTASRSYWSNAYQSLHPYTNHVRRGRPEPGFQGNFDPESDLMRAAELLDAVSGNRNPLPPPPAETLLAVRAKDNTLQPYRVYVPSRYDAAQRWPLVVALHAAAGDQDTYFVRDPSFLRLGEERGYILVTPAARSTSGQYTSEAEQDVLDTISTVQALFSIDPKAVFLTGHSLGGVGVLQIASRNPARFAGLASVGGILPVATIPEAAVAIPLLLVAGGKDAITPPELVKPFAVGAAARLKKFQLLERPADDHFALAVTSLPQVFDFFDSLRNAPVAAPAPPPPPKPAP